MQRYTLETSEASNAKSNSTSWMTPTSESPSCSSLVEPTLSRITVWKEPGRDRFCRSQRSAAALDRAKWSQRNAPFVPGAPASKAAAASQSTGRAAWPGVKA